jgi:hypothetical protein
MLQDKYELYLDYQFILQTTSAQEAISILLGLHNIFEVKFTRHSRGVQLLYGVMFQEQNELSKSLRKLLLSWEYVIQNKSIVHQRQSTTTAENNSIMTENTASIESNEDHPNANGLDEDHPNETNSNESHSNKKHSNENHLNENHSKKGQPNKNNTNENHSNKNHSKEGHSNKNNPRENHLNDNNPNKNRSNKTNSSVLKRVDTIQNQQTNRVNQESRINHSFKRKQPLSKSLKIL